MQLQRSMHAAGPRSALTSPCVSRCSPAIRRQSGLHHARSRPAVSVRASATVEQLPELKKQLLSIIGATESCSKYPPEAGPILDQIDEVVVAAGAPQITSEAIDGSYEQVLSNTSFVDADGCLGLGTLTFNQFGPKDLKVKLVQVTLQQGVNEPGEYSTEATFEVVEGELKGLQGKQKTLGRYEISKDTPGRQDVYFAGVQLLPVNKEGAQLQRWIDAMAPHNEGMHKESGVAEKLFPGGEAHGFRDFRIADDDLAFSVGNRKSYVVVQPLKA